MRVAVTGASGFIGSAARTRSHDSGHDVTALTRRPERYKGAGTPVAADIADADSLRRGSPDTSGVLPRALLADSDFAERDRGCARVRGRRETAPA